MARLSDVPQEISVGLVGDDRHVTEILHRRDANIAKIFWLGVGNHDCRSVVLIFRNRGKD
jgi:hypothetical protein